MNVSLQYEKPLLLLFSDFNIDALDALLSENNDIVLRKKRQIWQCLIIIIYNACQMVSDA